jgi:predicted nucleotidyltransferase component of viral defense system
MANELKPFETAVIAVTAVAAEDDLFERLVLKGGNALQLVHKLGARASVDLDFSMEDDVTNALSLGEKLRKSLVARFDAAGFEMFDFIFEPRPSEHRPEVRWGGYRAEYKLARRGEAARVEAEELKRLKKKGVSVGPILTPEQRRDVLQRNFNRTHSIDISRYEYCRDKELAEVDGYQCYVYTPAMIAAEKLRAICQQMSEYSQRKNPSRRARDFYDIHAIVAYAGVDLTKHTHLLEGMFRAKDVPLELLRLIANYREFHRSNWDAVKNAVVGEDLQPFDHYFDFVLAEVQKL